MNNRRKPTQAESLGAGIVAGAVEGFITYPAEFVKTKAQFSRSAAGEVSETRTIQRGEVDQNRSRG
jgi:solute carrier family 25 citrate transporter 1